MEETPSGGRRRCARARATGRRCWRESRQRPPGSNLVIEVGSANNGADDDVFVPEEEESGAEWSQYGTQGDALMAAKALRKGKKGINSPGLDSPASPVRLLASNPRQKKTSATLETIYSPSSLGASISFSHACIAFSLLARSLPE